MALRTSMRHRIIYMLATYVLPICVGRRIDTWLLAALDIDTICIDPLCQDHQVE